jgi:methylmalonyl-CoA mutase
MTNGKSGPTSGNHPLLGAFPDVSYQDWRAQVERGLKGGDFTRRLVTPTLEGLDIQPLYTSDSWPGDSDPSGLPGAPPYRRGALPIGRYSERWDVRSRHDHPDPDVVQTELADDLARGASSIWLRFDRATRLGHDLPPTGGTTLAAACDERGVPCLGAEQLQRLLSQVPIPHVTVSLDAGANALPLAACFAHMLLARGVALERAQVWFNADPLGALARDGELPGSLESARRQLTELARWTRDHAPLSRSVSVSAVPYHDAGANAAQELGLMLATGVSYLRWLTEAGLSISEASRQLSFTVPVGPDFFMEIAKLRALRQCWSNAIAACGGDRDAQGCVVHAMTSDRSKTARDPWVNLLRETSETFAAASGGADAITSAGFDRRIGPSDAFARRIAANLQVILDQESHVTRVADPAGGSYYVEQLTDQLAAAGWQQLQAIESAGGMPEALTSGWVDAALAGVARAREALIATRKQAITGVSEFAQLSEERPLRPTPDAAALASARRAALAALPDAPARDDAIAALRRSDGHENGRVALAIRAAAEGATIGQLSAALAGDDVATRRPALPIRRPAQPYERLRDACEAAPQRPAVFLCNLGPIAQHKARAQFASGLFQAGGLQVLDNDGFENPEAAADAFAGSGAKLCALCGSDDAYPQWVDALGPLLGARGAKRIILAGRFGAEESRYRGAGVTDSIYMGCNVIETLTRLLQAVGVEP